MPHHYLLKNLLFLFTDNYKVQKARTRNEMKQNSRTSHVEQILSSPPLLLLFLFPSHYLDTFSKPKNGWIEWEKKIKTKQVKHKIDQNEKKNKLKRKLTFLNSSMIIMVFNEMQAVFSFIRKCSPTIVVSAKEIGFVIVFIVSESSILCGFHAHRAMETLLLFRLCWRRKKRRWRMERWIHRLRHLYLVISFIYFNSIYLI